MKLKNIAKTMTVLSLVLSIAGSTLTVNAAPKKMQDGTIFDAEFYAATYPEVAAALGNTEKALYKHYQAFGKAEGRLPVAPDQTVSDTTVPAAPVREIPEFAKTLFNQVNNEVAVGLYIVDYLSNEKKQPEPLEVNGRRRSHWYHPYWRAWEYLYSGVFCNNKHEKSTFTDGRLMTMLVDDNIAFGGAEMLLDFGYFTEYVDIWKARGIITPDYQLPETFYTMTITGILEQEPWYVYYAIDTDCPEALYPYYTSYYNRPGRPYIDVPEYKQYTAKYLREQEAKKAQTN